MAEITHEMVQAGRCKRFPWYRVDYRSQQKSSYADNTQSRSFETVDEAIAFAETLSRPIPFFREVLEMHGEYFNKSYGGYIVKHRTIAKWGIKRVKGRRVLGRVK